MPVLDRVHLMARAADALQAAGDGGRRLDLDHQVDGAHVDAELERRRGDQRAELSCLEQLLDLEPLLARNRPVVRAHERFAGQLVERAGQTLGEPAAVDEEQRRAMRPNQFEQPRVNAGPDRRAPRPCGARPARGRGGLASRAMSSTGTSTRSSSRFGTRASTTVTGRQAIGASAPSNSS